MTKLYILGPAEIRNCNGDLAHSFLAGPKRLALLTYLLLHEPRGYHRRDSLLTLFWPDQNQKSARNALSNMLYHIRRTLGKEVIENRGSEEIRINESLFWTDALQFEKAIKNGDHVKALDLYRSELLKGFHVREIASEFEQWLDQERQRFHALAIDGSLSLAEEAYLRADNPLTCKWAKRSSELDPFSEHVHHKLIAWLSKIGEQQEATKLYNAFSTRIWTEFSEKPSPYLQDLMDSKIHDKPLRTSGSSAKKSAKNASIAVLPFKTLGAKDESLFTDAIHGDIIVSLSGNKKLHVISRFSVSNYDHTNMSVTEIAKELDVNYILEGEVQQSSNELCLCLWLTNMAKQRTEWSQSYKRALTAENIFQIQGEIKKALFQVLQVADPDIIPEEKNANPTRDLDAYRLYSQGRSSLDRRTEEGIYAGLDCFQGCIELDPDYALAWAGLADALSLLDFYGFARPSNSPTAIQAAEKAVSLDKHLGEARTALGIARIVNREAPAARDELERAVQLTPNFAEAFIWLAWVDLVMGYPSIALNPAIQSVKLNPLSPVFRVYLAEIYLANNMVSAALAEAKRGREINPEYPLAHYMEGMALYHAKEYQQALKAFEKTLSMVPEKGSPPRAQVRMALSLSHFALGDHEKSKALKSQILERIEPFPLGIIQAVYGDKQKAYDLLSKVKGWDSFSSEILRYFFPDELKEFRKDSRYPALIRSLDRSWNIRPNMKSQHIKYGIHA